MKIGGGTLLSPFLKGDACQLQHLFHPRHIIPSGCLFCRAHSRANRWLTLRLTMRRFGNESAASGRELSNRGRIDAPTPSGPSLRSGPLPPLPGLTPDPSPSKEKGAARSFDPTAPELSPYAQIVFTPASLTACRPRGRRPCPLMVSHPRTAPHPWRKR